MTNYPPSLNEAQKAILRAFSCVDSKETEIKLQEYISKFFQAQLDEEMDSLFAAGVLNEEKIEEYLGTL